MAEYPYTLKQIAEITGKSNTALFSFIKENNEFITEHSLKNGRFVKYDEDALQCFVNRFGRVDTPPDDDTPQETAPGATESHNSEEKGVGEGSQRESVIAAFEAQIEALKAERDALSFKLEQREKDCAEWRTQAGQALTALSKEQERVERLEERLAGYLPAPSNQNANDSPIIEAEANKPTRRKLSFRERISVLFGHELEIK